jgi:GNAT superfamily N-acetyltransferase
MNVNMARRDIVRRTGVSAERITIRAYEADDVEEVARAFEPAPYSNSVDQYERYLGEQNEGTRVMLIAFVRGEVAGYVNVLWESDYELFAAASIPEINDLNVLAPYRGRAIGTALVRAAEAVIREAGGATVGIGVGTTPEYDAARRLYPALGYAFDRCGVRATSNGDAEYLTRTL